MATKTQECGTKEPLSKAEAEARAWRLTRTGLAPMRAYACRHCRSWHIGHRRHYGRRGRYGGGRGRAR